MKKVLFIWVVLFSFSLLVNAEEKITFTAQATPDAVAVGDRVRLSYTVTTQNVKDFQGPSSFKGFENLMGLNRSVYNSYEMKNGKMTSVSSITYTYTLLAEEEGTFVIPGASITADGDKMVSNAVTIKVLPADKKAEGASSKDDLLIVSTVSKTNVYEQEALLLTYKIYTVANLQGFSNVKLPDFKGFHSQEVELPNDRQWGLDNYKGRNYRSTVFRQFILFPQQAGELVIEPARFDAVVHKMSDQPLDPMDMWFNGGAAYVEERRILKTPKLTIHVKSLPANKPDIFSAGVGDFNISSSISQTELKANEAVTLKVVISGTGNLQLISEPKVEFPADFDVYDSKVDNKFRLTTAGLSGNKVIEYVAIPRNAGTFKIPSVQFSYFDPSSNTYKTLNTEEYTLHVEKGSGGEAQAVTNYTNKEDLKVLNEDIRYIKLNDVTLAERGKFFYGSMAYVLCYLIPALIFVAFFILYRKQIALNRNVVKMKNKRANKVAVKRMKLAGKLLVEGKKEEFYDEVLKALWGYVSDKLNIPVSRLSKDNVEGELQKCGVEAELIKSFLDVLDTCEFARFAPGDESSGMDKTYAASLEIISKMENSIK